MQMKIVLDKIEQDWRVLHDNKQIETLRTSYNSGRLLTIAYLGKYNSIFTKASPVVTKTMRNFQA